MRKILEIVIEGRIESNHPLRPLPRQRLMEMTRKNLEKIEFAILEKIVIKANCGNHVPLVLKFNIFL